MKLLRSKNSGAFYYRESRMENDARLEKLNCSRKLLNNCPAEKLKILFVLRTSGCWKYLRLERFIIYQGDGFFLPIACVIKIFGCI